MIVSHINYDNSLIKVKYFDASIIFMILINVEIKIYDSGQDSSYRSRERYFKTDLPYN